MKSGTANRPAFTIYPKTVVLLIRVKKRRRFLRITVH